MMRHHHSPKKNEKVEELLSRAQDMLQRSNDTIKFSRQQSHQLLGALDVPSGNFGTGSDQRLGAQNSPSPHKKRFPGAGSPGKRFRPPFHAQPQEVQRSKLSVADMQTIARLVGNGNNPSLRCDTAATAQQTRDKLTLQRDDLEQELRDVHRLLDKRELDLEVRTRGQSRARIIRSELQLCDQLLGKVATDTMVVRTQHMLSSVLANTEGLERPGPPARCEAPERSHVRRFCRGIALGVVDKALELCMIRRSCLSALPLHRSGASSGYVSSGASDAGSSEYYTPYTRKQEFARTARSKKLAREVGALDHDLEQLREDQELLKEEIEVKKLDARLRGGNVDGEAASSLANTHSEVNRMLLGDVDIFVKETRRNRLASTLKWESSQKLHVPSLHTRYPSLSDLGVRLLDKTRGNGYETQYFPNVPMQKSQKLLERAETKLALAKMNLDQCSTDDGVSSVRTDDMLLREVENTQDETVRLIAEREAIELSILQVDCTLSTLAGPHLPPYELQRYLEDVEGRLCLARGRLRVLTEKLGVGE